MVTLIILSFLLLAIVYYTSHRYRYCIDTVTSTPQKFHTSPTPRNGGLAIILTLIPFLPMHPFMIAASIAFLSGIIEDYYGKISPFKRLTLHLLSAITFIFLTKSVITDLSIVSLPWNLGLIFTIFSIIGMINAINIIDGFNGLASGISLLIFSTLAFISHVYYPPLFENILMIIYAIIPFFIINIVTGKIFLGDGGAYFLGALLSMTGITLYTQIPTMSAWYILTLFIYPVWEVLFSFYRKIANNTSPFLPDKLHFHMLVFNKIQSNVLTSIIIIVGYIPFMILSTFFIHSTPIQMGIIAIFITLYHFFYSRLT